MNIEKIRLICLKKKGAWEDLPFGDDPLVMKIGTKMFALLSLGKNQISLKCDPLLSIEYRNDYAAIIPGYHLNKKHWNTILLDSEISDELMIKMINMSYELVFNSLTKKNRNAIKFVDLLWNYP